MKVPCQGKQHLVWFTPASVQVSYCVRRIFICQNQQRKKEVKLIINIGSFKAHDATDAEMGTSFGKTDSSAAGWRMVLFK